MHCREIASMPTYAASCSREQISAQLSQIGEEQEFRVQVSIPSHHICDAHTWRPYVLFEVHVQIRQVNFIFRKRYSQLLALHKQFKKNCTIDAHSLSEHTSKLKERRFKPLMDKLLAELMTRRLPDFPPAPWFVNHARNLLALERRKQQLIAYLTRVLQIPAILQHPALSRSLDLDEPTRSSLSQVFAYIVRRKLDGCEGVFDSVFSARQRTTKEFVQSQTFHTLPALRGSLLGYAPCSYSHATSFRTFFQADHCRPTTIPTIDGQEWFKVVYLNHAVVQLRDRHFKIYNMKDEPLMLLKEMGHSNNYKYKILSLMNSETPTPVCSVQREDDGFCMKYSFTAATDRKKLVVAKSTPDPSNDTLPLFIGKRQAATLQLRRTGRSSIYNSSSNSSKSKSGILDIGGYDVHVLPRQDIILSLALAICITRITSAAAHVFPML